jgi:hypothetical protein
MSEQYPCPLSERTCQSCHWFIRIHREGLVHEACAVVHIAQILNLICMEIRGTDDITSKASVRMEKNNV